MSISNPTSNGVATVSGNPGALCSAAGTVTGSNVVEVRVLCEQIASSNPSTFLGCAASDTACIANVVKTNGLSVANTSGAWAATNIPTAQCSSDPDTDPKWNALHVCVFFSGMPTPPPTHEVVIFKGQCGTC